MSDTFYQDRHYWIIGASDGIGAALAEELSMRGARLTISARREAALETVAARCFGSVTPRPMDLADPEDLRQTLNAATAHGPLDGVICAAALYDPATVTDMDLEAAERLMRVNLLGPLALGKYVPEKLRPGGQLVFVGSVAGYVGLPGGQPYSASKAAVANLAESLALELADRVDVRLVSPGFVRTRLTDKNDFDMPELMEPEAAASAIADGLARPGFEIHFPKRFTRKLKVLRTLPYGMRLRLLKRAV